MRACALWVWVWSWVCVLGEGGRVCNQPLVAMMILLLTESVLCALYALQYDIAAATPHLCVVYLQ